MRAVNTGQGGQFGKNFSLCIGLVKDNADPSQHGRLKVYIPSIDSKDFNVVDLPWATYCSPFGGTTAGFKIGREADTVPGASSYGFWAIPKNGAQVLIGFLEGDPNLRFWLGCFFQPELNRTLPQSINTPPLSSEIDESGMWPQDTIPHYLKNLTEAGLGPHTKHWKTRGGFERSVSYPENKTKNKPTTDGYAPKPLEKSKADSQTISLTSPGRHFISLHDIDEYCRMRFKTTAGSQIIMDDTNERIYISTAMGRNWIEIDEGSGKIHFYTTSKFNIHSQNDLNLYSSENINIVAKKRVNIQSEERGIKIQGHHNVDILSTNANIKITASRDIHIKTTKGDKAQAVPEKIWCSPPPWSGEALGLRRDWAEEAGSVTSKIFINSIDGTEVRVDEGFLNMTTKQNIEMRSVEGSINQQANRSINRKAEVKINDDARIMNHHAIESINGTIYKAQQFVGSFFAGVSETDRAVPSATAEKAKFSKKALVKPKMIIPEHEAWVRDEDEQMCPTPRNPNYQG